MRHDRAGELARVSRTAIALAARSRAREDGVGLLDDLLRRAPRGQHAAQRAGHRPDGRPRADELARYDERVLAELHRCHDASTASLASQLPPCWSSLRDPFDPLWPAARPSRRQPNRWTDLGGFVPMVACCRMAEIETIPEPAPRLADEPRPAVSLVVPVFNEERTLEEVYRQSVAALESLGKPYEIIFVDDGSSDRTWAVIERLNAGDATVRAVRFKRNFGQHPAMHAGLARARGDILVTMDGDLQNSPADLPKLVAAVEAGADVASGRRAARDDSWGRTLPSKLVNGMLRRFTGVRIDDFGCAFNAYSRSAIEPVLGLIGKQKFTKALVLSAGASVVEVELDHRAREGPSRYGPLAPHAARAPRPRGLLAAADPVGRRAHRRRLLAARGRSRDLGRRHLGAPRRLPRAPLPRRARARRPRGAGIHSRARRGVPGQDPARRRRAVPSTPSTRSSS